MRWRNVLRLRLRSLFKRDEVDTELKAELRQHLEQESAANIASGMTPEQADYAARRSLGASALYEEECRDARGTGYVNEAGRDLRYAFRQMRKAPLFTAVAMITLGLGVGGNTAIFTFVNVLLLRALQVQNPAQLVSLNNGQNTNFSFPAYQDIRDRTDVLSGVAAFRFNPVHLSIGGDRNFRAWGYEASGNYFDLLGVHPYLGRFFSPNDDRPGAPATIVLGYGCWQARFASDPNVVGRSIKVNGFPFAVIGVARPEFTGTELIVNPEFWAPMSHELQVEPGNLFVTSRFASNVWVLGRLRDGVTRQQAQASLGRIAQQLGREYPKSDSNMNIGLYTPGLVGSAFRGPVTGFAAVLMTVAGLVLLLACINLAGLLLARASDRRKEMAVRLAIGAGRWQVVRQLLVENLLLASGGTVVGLCLTFALTRALSLWHPPFDIPANTNFQPDEYVLLFACAVAVAITFLFGLVPALQSTRVDLVPALKNGPAIFRQRRFTLRDGLVVCQIALSIALLISSVLVVRSLQNALHLNVGFEPAHAVSISFDLRLQGYSEAQGRNFQEKLLRKATTLPGVEAAGLIDYLPLRLGETWENIEVVGKPRLPKGKAPSARIFHISPGYLRAAKTHLITGRDIDEHDRPSTPPVVLVNRAFVSQMLKSEGGLGSFIRLGSDEKAKPIQIVGIVEDGKYGSLNEEPTPVVFESILQDYNGWTTLVARTSLPSLVAIQSLRQTVSGLDRNLPLFNVGSLEEQLALPLFPARFVAIALGAFGTMAALLAAIGVFALVAYGVARRSREIGIRMALGARASQVLSYVLRRTVTLCFCGGVLGAGVTFATAHLLSTLLYGVSPHDPLTYVIALCLMAAVAVMACWHPAMRAIRIDPAQTLRGE